MTPGEACRAKSEYAGLAPLSRAGEEQVKDVSEVILHSIAHEVIGRVGGAFRYNSIFTGTSKSAEDTAKILAGLIGSSTTIYADSDFNNPQSHQDARERLAKFLEGVEDEGNILTVLPEEMVRAMLDRCLGGSEGRAVDAKRNRHEIAKRTKIGAGTLTTFYLDQNGVMTVGDIGVNLADVKGASQR